MAVLFRAAYVVVPISLCATVVAGCASKTNGSGSTTAPAGSSGAPRTPVTAASSAPAAAPDAKKLATLVLRASDVPSEWKGSPSSNDSSAGPDSDQAKLAACMGIPDSSPKQVAIADSDEFSNGESRISSTATSFSTQSVITSDKQGILGPKATACFQQGLQSTVTSDLPAGTSVSNFTISIAPGPNGGPSDVVAVVHASVVVHSSAVAVPVYIDVALIAGKLVEADVDFFGFETRIDTSIERTAIDAVANRVAAL